MKLPFRIEGPEVSSRSKQLAAFTLVELLVSMAIFAMIMVVIFGLTQQTGNAWRSTSSKIEAFQDARAAFESLTDNLSQATLNTYYDYANAQGQTRNSLIAASGTAAAASFVPATYTRFSDLHFISGNGLLPTQVTQSVFFQEPAGYTAATNYQQMDTLLNACGYYISFEKDASRPGFLTSPDRYRYRLFQFLQPSEQLTIYNSGSTGNAWFANYAMTDGARTQIADNVIALIILPKYSDQDSTAILAQNYKYDSHLTDTPNNLNQLPPMVEVVMVAIDEASAKRLENGSSAPDLGLDSSLFTDPSNLDADLDKLTGRLTDRRVNYRVFRTTVPLRSSKWSSK